MCEVWTMGEMLVEIMRPKTGVQLYTPAEFVGPFPSGAPTIFIDTVARLGHTAGIFGGVGADDFGKVILDRLKADEVDTNYVYEDNSCSTAVAFVTYFEDGSRKFIYHIDNTPAVKTKAFITADIPHPKYFHIMGCSLTINENFKQQIMYTALSFAQAGSKISFDPNIRVELLKGHSAKAVLGEILQNCSVIMPGIDELKMLTGAEDIKSGVQKLFRYKNMEIIALKRGSQGCTVFSREQSIDLPAFKIDAVDPTGAGDCFDAALLCALIEGESLHRCALIASAAGALNAQRFGPMEGVINKREIERIIASNEY